MALKIEQDERTLDEFWPEYLKVELEYTYDKVELEYHSWYCKATIRRYFVFFTQFNRQKNLSKKLIGPKLSDKFLVS